MRLILILLGIFYSVLTIGQIAGKPLSGNWQFRQSGTSEWRTATVPGSIYTDLQQNKIIADPFYRDNEKSLYWIDSVSWEYRIIFRVDSSQLSKKHIDLVFNGLDTYANVYLNDSLILSSDNMFRQWTIDIKTLLKKKDNQLFIRFKPALLVADSIAYTNKPITLPDHNRVYVRKAQYQFGWDWGPRLIGCGIWKDIWIDAYHQVSKQSLNQQQRNRIFKQLKHDIDLVQQADKDGRSFYFTQKGKPVYAKGANWIPAHIFPAVLKKSDYRTLLQMARDAHMNMLRVWGGGIYETDYFYDLCDEYGIMVWQDFMFAGGMYPGDPAFFANVKEEVRQQIMRLRHHKSIVLWCGNNEIDEAWKNWGWQSQFNLHGADSALVYANYKKLFMDSLPQWVKDFDGKRPYVHTSPLHGWGRKESLTEGDSHYWGVWWGLQDWEMFKTKTGRFVSEYGMQAMPNQQAIESYTGPDDRFVFSGAIRWHQKASNGFAKLNHYLHRYFIDSSKINRLSLDEYAYVTQCLQYYILKNSIAVHRSHEPYNMGTLLWQLNDCWPVTSWSIIDFNKQPKAAWYAVKNAYRNGYTPKPDSLRPRELTLLKPSFDIQRIGVNRISIRCNTDAAYVQLKVPGKFINFSDHFFDLRKGEVKLIETGQINLSDQDIQMMKIRSYYDILTLP